MSKMNVWQFNKSLYTTSFPQNRHGKYQHSYITIPHDTLSVPLSSTWHHHMQLSNYKGWVIENILNSQKADIILTIMPDVIFCYCLIKKSVWYREDTVKIYRLLFHLTSSAEKPNISLKSWIWYHPFSANLVKASGMSEILAFKCYYIGACYIWWCTCTLQSNHVEISNIFILKSKLKNILMKPQSEIVM